VCHGLSHVIGKIIVKMELTSHQYAVFNLLNYYLLKSEVLYLCGPFNKFRFQLAVAFNQISVVVVGYTP